MLREETAALTCVISGDACRGDAPRGAAKGAGGKGVRFLRTGTKNYKNEICFLVKL